MSRKEAVSKARKAYHFFKPIASLEYVQQPSVLGSLAFQSLSCKPEDDSGRSCFGLPWRWEPSRVAGLPSSRITSGPVRFFGNSEIGVCGGCEALRKHLQGLAATKKGPLHKEMDRDRKQVVQTYQPLDVQTKQSLLGSARNMLCKRRLVLASVQAPTATACKAGMQGLRSGHC